MALGILIEDATTTAQLDAVRDLFRAFIAWHFDRHSDQLHLVLGYFDEDAYEAELAGLPGKYAPPKGRLLLATVDGKPAGCVAIRKIDERTCEMKRLFVYKEFQGFGIGKALAKEIIESAKKARYSKMLLDTGGKQFEAKALYHSLGFVDIAAYYELPQEQIDWLTFMSLDL